MPKKTGNKAKDCFEAGLIIGRLQVAMAVAEDDARVDGLRREAKSALSRIGLRVGKFNQSKLPGLVDQLEKILNPRERSCFELGINIFILQSNLKMVSIASEPGSKVSDASLSGVVLPLENIIQEMRIQLAQIGILKEVDPFLHDVEKGLSSSQQLRKVSAKLFKESEITRVQIEVWIEQELSDEPVKTTAKKRWSWAEIFTILVAILAIVVSLLIPEVRRWLGLE